MPRPLVASADALDALEPRRLLSTINWVNRGMASDRFGEVFGGQANVARGVIDAAIDRWERVITDFNNGTNTFDLTIAMRGTGTGFGGVGGGSGVIVFDRGNDTTGDGLGDGDGWFLDPTPMDDAEFNGTLINAFAGSAPNGSPAFGKSDLLTVAMHEMGHAFGAYSNATMNALGTDTNIADPQGGGSTYWTFDGPSVQHLFTSYDSGGGGSDTNGVQHSARGTTSVNFGGTNWRGATELMNAIYSTSQRKTINNVLAWAMHDAWGYDVALPETFGTFYSLFDESSGTILVRGSPGADPSADDIQIGLFGPLLVVSVDIGDDVPGTGPLPGEGNLDAFVSTYLATSVNSIVIQSGNGDDTITINSLPSGVGVSIDAGTGNDTVELGNGDLDSNLLGPITFTGGDGTDALVLDDTTDGPGADAYTFTATALSKTIGQPISWLTVESVTLNASPNADSITVNGTLPGTVLTINGRNGSDTFNVQNTDLFSPVVITTGTGNDVVNVNTDDTGNALAFFPATESVQSLNIGIGGRLALAQTQVANTNVLTANGLSIDNGGVLDLTNGSMVLNYAGASPYVAVRNYIASARANGAWTGSGITSFAAFAANPKITTLGILTSAEYFGIYGNGATFAGQTIAGNAILVKYTYYGDANFDGRVTFDDYVRIDTGFNAHRTGWLNGDFNGDGVVNFDDYVLIDTSFNTQGVPLSRRGGVRMTR